MASATHKDFKIKTFRDGSLFRARVEKKDGTPVEHHGHSGDVWETPQCPDAQGALGTAKFAIDTGKVR